MTRLLHILGIIFLWLHWSHIFNVCQLQSFKKKTRGSTLETDVELDQNPTLKNKTDPDPAI